MIVTVHKPLVNILKNLKGEREIICISRLKHTIVDWKFLDIWYVRGSKNAGPNTLSRQHINMAEEKLVKLSNVKVVETYKSDMVMQKLLTYVKHGFPDCKSKILELLP